jgi:hypothetical protein
LQSQARQAQEERRAGTERPSPAERRLQIALDVLQRYAALQGYQRYYERSTQHQTVVEMHAHKLQMDRVNAAERENLIRRGLEGLSLYHQGGISQDDVTRTILLGQMLGLLIQGR